MNPPTLREDGPGGKKRAAHAAAYESGSAPPSDFPGHWTRPDIRGALLAMQGRICAYCGADISEAGIDVEHFRPKSGYWWLAYEFTNYLLSCIVCNQKNKRTAFPICEGGQRISYERRREIDREPRILLDPSRDDVDDLVCFDWINTAGRIEPRPGLPAERKEEIRRALAVFRVNRKAAQVRKRLELQMAVVEKVDQGRAAEVRELAIRFRPHSIVARQILLATAPSALPTLQEELTWLFRELAVDLTFKLTHLAESPSEADRNEAEELLWALAVLWKDPPAGTPASVESLLDAALLTSVVKDYFDRL